jgi:diguanylate cyclase (GGDEF)-like protein/PAS domain S-box-containing protein
MPLVSDASRSWHDKPIGRSLGIGSSLQRFVLWVHCVVVLAAIFVQLDRAGAVEAVRVPPDAAAIDLTKAVETYKSEADRLLVSTAPGADGIVRRIEVRAREEGTRPAWIVFALTNDTGEQIERLIVAPHYRFVASGIVWPDLGSSRLSAITASHGFAPERETSNDADLFRLTLDPGATVTYVAELGTANLPQLTLWEPEAYKDKITSLALYDGIVIGVAGLVALFLTIVFVVKGAAIFPAAAALAWTVLTYISIDFGFWSGVFGASSRELHIWRAGAETFLAATLLVFLFAYLKLDRWHFRTPYVAIAWALFLAGLVCLSVYDPPVAAGIARISLGAIAALGFILVVYLAAHGYDRAILLVPTWFLLLAWVVAAGFAVMGALTNDLVSPALMGGLVLLVMLIGFTILQSAFAGGALGPGTVSDVERKALALGASGDILFDWNVIEDRVFVGEELEARLGLDPGSLEGPAGAWLGVLHPAERDRFRTGLDTILDRRAGRIADDFRLRSAAGHYLWFRLKARPVVAADGEVSRIIGLMSDVTEAKVTEERLLHDAVHDTLTGLPNREIFLDRLSTALTLAQTDRALRPTVIAIDVDGLAAINEAAGLPAGDSVLATIARRVGRILKPHDSITRLAADQFAVLVLSEDTADELIAFAGLVRRAITTPVTFGEHEFPLAVSMGFVLFDPQIHRAREDMVEDAEVAMRRAKRAGGNRIEIFTAAMRPARAECSSLCAELARARETGEAKILFRPIVRLEDRTVAGFETVLRWDHPRLGRLGLDELVAADDESSAIVDLGLFVLESTMQELAAWQIALDVDPPIFATLNVPSRHWLRTDLLHEVKAVQSKFSASRGSLLLEVKERLVMDNPEFAARLLTRLREQGLGLALDGFGTGTMPLACLERFPFDMIGLDGALLRPSPHERRAVLVQAIVGLAHDLGMDVVAKGTDAEKDAADAAKLGCDYALGFAFGQPIGMIDARKLVGAATIAA